MSASHDLERRLAAHFAAEAPSGAPEWVLTTALDTIDDTQQRRLPVHVSWWFPAMNMSARLAAMAVAVVGIIGLTLVGTTAPQPVPEPLSWTPARYAEDWPAPPRPEPPSGAPDVLLVRGDQSYWDPDERAWEELEFVDPVGDIGDAASAWVDIRRVLLSRGYRVSDFGLELAGGIPTPVPSPAEAWIAYGVVIDTDEDGAANVRIGVDNMPGGDHRAWYTDLVKGETKSKAGPPYGWVGEALFGIGGGRVGLDTWYPGEASPPFEPADRAALWYIGPADRFYAWASVIQGGRVVATDYAPDAGWLVEGDQPGLPLAGPDWSTEREISSDLTIVATLRFTDDGQLIIDAGCRKGTANAVVGPDTLQVSNLSLRGDGCRTDAGNAFEAEILSVLSAEEIAYTLDAGVLELRAGQDVLRLQGMLEGPG